MTWLTPELRRLARRCYLLTVLACALAGAIKGTFDTLTTDPLELQP